jgi:hypothetical protein
LPIYKEVKGKDYIFYGERNDYPNYLLRIYNNSAKHNAIVTGKVDYICGNGWGVKTEEAIKRVFARNNFSLSQYNDAISSQVFGGKTFVDVAKEAQAQAQAQATQLSNLFNPLKGK